jgi:hypothetical protein
MLYWVDAFNLQTTYQKDCCRCYVKGHGCVEVQKEEAGTHF